MDNFRRLCTLGKGTYSEVIKVQRISNQKEYAMKEVKITSLNKKEKESALTEIGIMASVKHKNVVQYKEAFFEEPYLCIVMELADSGDLKSKIE